MGIGPFDSEHEEMKALNLVMKYICNKPVSLVSDISALFCLLVSQKYKVHNFTKICLHYLIQKVWINF